MSSGVWDEIKKPLYKTTAEVSRSSAKLGNATGFDYLENEGKKNTDNPGRAIGKAAAAVASWYAGGLLGAGAGATGGAAGEAGTLVAEQAAEEAAKQAAIEAMKQEALNSAQYAGQQGLLSGGEQVASEGAKRGLLDTTRHALKSSFGMGGGQGGVNVGSSMSAAPGPGVVAPGKQFMAMMDSGLINSGNSQLAGKIGTDSGLLGMNGGQRAAMNLGGKLMQQPQQQPMSQPMRQQQSQPYEPMQSPYGGGGGMYGGLMGMSEEEKRRLRAMGYPV